MASHKAESYQEERGSGARLSVGAVTISGQQLVNLSTKDTVSRSHVISLCVPENPIFECIAFIHQITIAMRLIKESIERDGSGFVTLYPEDSEDMVCI